MHEKLNVLSKDLHASVKRFFIDLENQQDYYLDLNEFSKKFSFVLIEFFAVNLVVLILAIIKASGQELFSNYKKTELVKKIFTELEKIVANQLNGLVKD